MKARLRVYYWRNHLLECHFSVFSWHCVVSWVSHWHPWRTLHSEVSKDTFYPPEISSSLAVPLLFESSQAPKSGYRSWISHDQFSEKKKGSWCTATWSLAPVPRFLWRQTGVHQTEMCCCASESHLWFRWLENPNSGA